ncbi:WecA-like glycosyltransferase [Novipirellula galeiformis]|uniref:WecA-like glycosyltransferase n=1 Tax=Novipirellula galeiformis TaxID=2528004 RepID=A0A5C6CUQ3_9BACT|nr:MraY family glycosyltransferase [Novipirellula galeiformis]TWU27227.1 WecA-like glycosyltransferase [Novipirellula galeiformis]
MNWLLLSGLTVSAASALILVPLIRAIAIHAGLTDKPDSERKLHQTPVALGGGVAVFAALLIGLGTTVLIDRHFNHFSLGHFSSKWYVLFLAAAAVLLVGLIDDRWPLRGRLKLLFQCLIVASVVGSGTIIKQINVIGFHLELGNFAFPITMLWLLIAINALNLIDGADGMATTVGCIVCAGLGLLSSRSGVNLTGTLCFVLSSALLGFLVFNRPPATIYLGDAGSMMIGFFVGVLSIWSNTKESTVLASAPVAILALPLFDSSAAILRRWLTGRSLYATDRAHLHHLLQAKYGSLGMLAVVASMCLITTTLSFVSTYYSLPWLAIAGALLVLSILILTRSFGHAESKLLAIRTLHFCRSFSASPTQCDTQKQHRIHALQGSGCWETVWEPLVELARSHELASIKINLNLAWLHESYHASWHSVRLPDKALQLTMCVPLFTRCTKDGRELVIGRLEIVAPAKSPQIYTEISQFIEHLNELVPQIDHIIESLENPRKADPGAFFWPKSEQLQGPLGSTPKGRTDATVLSSK